MILYLTTKFATETAWCLVGLVWFRRESVLSLLPSGARYGLLRLALGWLLGLSIRSLGRPPEWVVWFGILLPLRWMAWSIVGTFIDRREIRLRALLAIDRRSNLWRLSGVGLSTLADLPALLAGIWTGNLWP